MRVSPRGPLSLRWLNCAIKGGRLSPAPGYPMDARLPVAAAVQYTQGTMAKLIYVMPTSLDGYVEDETGKFDWGTPDEEGFTFITDLERPIGTYLYGRKMYQTMAVWETPDVIPPDVVPGGRRTMLEFARTWQGAEKIVYSRSLETVSTPKTRLEREFDPQTIRELKAQSPHDITVGGPMLAAQAIRSGLVDEIQLFVVPMLIGGGKHVLPSDVCVQLDLLDERHFGNGMVYLRYRTRA
jgi:dihydrofolate reductase